ncbi:unnamed protein product [Phaeothamnion confervicola]
MGRAGRQGNGPGPAGDALSAAALNVLRSASVPRDFWGRGRQLARRVGPKWPACWIRQERWAIAHKHLQGERSIAVKTRPTRQHSRAVGRPKRRRDERNLETLAVL